MSRRDRKTLPGTFGFASVILLFIIQSKIKELFPLLDNAIVYLIFVLAVGLFIAVTLDMVLPNSTNNKQKRTSTKNNSNVKNTSSPKKSIKKQIKTQASDKPYNIMPLEKLLTADLKSMSGYDFEELCFQYFKHNYKYVEQTSYAKDKGVDFIFKDRDGFRVAVQVKHRYESKNKVTLGEINQLNGARRGHNCTKGWFITSAGYTQNALNHALDLNIQTKDITWVENKILRWREKEAENRNLA